jgi:hypothetical protein
MISTDRQVLPNPSAPGDAGARPVLYFLLSNRGEPGNPHTPQ